MKFHIVPAGTVAPRSAAGVSPDLPLVVRLLAFPAGTWRLRPGPRPRLIGDRLATAVSSYAAGKSMRRIAVAAGVSTRTLRAALRRAGVEPREKRSGSESGLEREVIAQAARRHATGEPAAELARELGVSRATLYRALRRERLSETEEILPGGTR